jgi:hypothetical protein
VAAFALVAGAITVSGCGGGSRGKPLSDSEFVAKANAICANVYHQYANADLAGKAGVLTDGVAKLKELVPPAVKKRAFQRFLKAVEGEAGAWKEMTSGGGSSDLTDRFIEQESQIASSAAAMGTKRCATIAGKQ